MNIQNQTIELTVRELRALLAHASTDTTRRRICVVHFDLAAGVAVATSGLVLAVARSHERGEGAITIRREDLEDAIKGVPVRSCVRINVDMCTITVLGPTGAVEQRATVKPAKDFPGWQHVFDRARRDRDPPAAAVGINPALLQGLVKIQAAARDFLSHRRGTPSVDPFFRFEFGGALDPVIATLDAPNHRGGEYPTAWTVIVGPVRC